MTLFNLHNIGFSYPESRRKNALEGVNLNLRQGEIAALAGHVGSGKSTLLKILVGLLKPTAGSIFFRGGAFPAKGEKLRELRRQVGIVFQFAEAQAFETTVMREAAFGLENFGFPPENIEELAGEALRLTGLHPEKFSDKSPFELSGGERKRLALASVLALKPDMLLLDEPAAGLDPAGKTMLRRILKTRLSEGKSALMATHDLDFAMENCRRVIILHNGKIVYDGDREVFYDQEKLESWKLIPPELASAWSGLVSEGRAPDIRIFTVEEALENLNSEAL